MIKIKLAFDFPNDFFSLSKLIIFTFSKLLQQFPDVGGELIQAEY